MTMESDVSKYVTLDDIYEARKVMFSSTSIVKVLRTPMLIDVQYKSEKANATGARVSLKLENFQTMGSFKIRGIVNMMHQAPDNRALVTLSAGNYGRSFSYIAQKKGKSGVVVMHETVPKDRIAFIEGCGMKVELAPTSELQARVNEWVKKGYLFTHPFDNLPTIAGYGSIGLEILEDLPDVDIVVVCVGGGGLLSGILTAIAETTKNRRKQVRVIGVEPEGANSMYLSLQQGKAVKIQPKTIAHGLAPPYAGTITYEHVKKYDGSIVLVSDEEIKEAVKILYNDYKIVCETSGAAGFAALLSGKIGDVAGKNVACVISGGNIGIQELDSVMSKL